MNPALALTSAAGIDLLVGIDDTDNLDTRGTGYRARTLARGLADAGLAEMRGITRHQLLVDPRIPYTSHNSSACLQLAARASQDEIETYCREFLLEVAAVGADVGLCVATPDAALGIIDYACAAQREVLDRERARATAAAAGIRLAGLTGTHGGIIGALAGVGLFMQGDDGRYLWLKRLRELGSGVCEVGALRAQTGLDAVRAFDGDAAGDCLPDTARVTLGDWARPVRVAGQSVLLVENTTDGSHGYIVADKQRIKRFRP